MNGEKMRMVAVLEAVAIVALAAVLVSMVSMSIASSRSGASTDDDFLSNGELLADGTYVVVKELTVKNMEGSANFSVDANWSAIDIEVRAIDDSVVSWTVTSPGYPSGAIVVNGTALPFMQYGPQTIPAGATSGQATALYDQPTGEWTLYYDVQSGLVKIYIVEVELADV